jgi:hypothetical protein
VCATNEKEPMHSAAYDLIFVKENWIISDSVLAELINLKKRRSTMYKNVAILIDGSKINAATDWAHVKKMLFDGLNISNSNDERHLEYLFAHVFDSRPAPTIRSNIEDALMELRKLMQRIIVLLKKLNSNIYKLEYRNKHLIEKFISLPSELHKFHRKLVRLKDANNPANRGDIEIYFEAFSYFFIRKVFFEFVTLDHYLLADEIKNEIDNICIAECGGVKLKIERLV